MAYKTHLLADLVELHSLVDALEYKLEGLMPQAPTMRQLPQNPTMLTWDGLSGRLKAIAAQMDANDSHSTGR